MTQNLHNKIAPHITEIIARLQDAGFEAYIVGGAVRDFLLGREPKDYDISTSATPEQVKKIFRDFRCIIIGKRFRLVHLYYFRDDPIEISTFRKCPDETGTPEHPLRTGVAPEHMIFRDNEFGTAEDDAHRRDFTVNALFYDPVHDQLLDYTGHGVEDIRAGVVRCIGKPSLRFEEDPVRLLRALKLVGQYGFTLEKETEDALKECLDLIVHASISRMTLEFEKILRNPYGDDIILAFRKYDFLKYFLPELDRHFESDHAKYAMALWKRRNERVREGLYRPSISLILAVLALPYIERHFKNRPGDVWYTIPDMTDFFHDIILKAIAPHAIMRRVNANAGMNLLFQPRFRSGDDMSRYFNAAFYPNARELAAIQNDVLWHLEGFEERYPVVRSRVFNGTKKKRSGRRRRHGNGKKQEDHANTTAEN